ncbi:hypothetical protein GQ42DRAFT_165919, partial [Ramicandelaber brevisporus]
MTGKAVTTFMFALPKIVEKMDAKDNDKHVYEAELAFAEAYCSFLDLLYHQRSKYTNLDIYADAVDAKLQLVYTSLKTLADVETSGREKPYANLNKVTVKLHRMFCHLVPLIRVYGSTLYQSSEVFERCNLEARTARSRHRVNDGDALSLLFLVRSLLFNLNETIRTPLEEEVQRLARLRGTNLQPANDAIQQNADAEVLEPAEAPIQAEVAADIDDQLAAKDAQIAACRDTNEKLLHLLEKHGINPGDAEVADAMEV